MDYRARSGYQHCRCTTTIPTAVCSYPFCDTRRCGVCHICRFVASDPLPTLTPAEHLFLQAWRDGGPWEEWVRNPDVEHPSQLRLTTEGSRIRWKLAEMGLLDVS